MHRAKSDIKNNKSTISKNMKKIAKFIWICLGVVYAPVYIASWLLHKVARLVLAISYFGMLEKTVGKDIIKHLFAWHGKH